MFRIYHTANEEQYLGAPRWSPTGAWIAYVREYFGTLKIVRANGTGSRTVAKGYGISSPTWSPDGGRIAFSWRQDIYVVRTDGTHLTRLTRTPHRQEMELDWSSRHLFAASAAISSSPCTVTGRG